MFSRLLLLLVLLLTVWSVSCADGSSFVLTNNDTSVHDKRSVMWESRYYDGYFSKLELQAAMLSSYVNDMSLPLPCEIGMWKRVHIPTWHEEVGFFENMIDGNIAIVFRGAKISSSIYSDASLVPMGGLPNNSGLKVHRGFYREFINHREAILTFISRYAYRSFDSKVLITGHSKGGSVANICAFYLSYFSYGLGSRIMHTNFGSPRTGNSIYRSMVDQYVPYNTRFVTASNCYYSACFYVDFVTTLPLEASGYYHNGNPKFLHSYGPPGIGSYLTIIQDRLLLPERVSISKPVVLDNGYLFVELYTCSSSFEARLLSPTYPNSIVFIASGFVKIYTSVSWKIHQVPEASDYVVRFLFGGNSIVDSPLFSIQRSCIGSCLSCSKGICSICKDGFYGQDCALSCPGNCRTCSMDGSCKSCEIGWSDTNLNCLTPNCNDCSGFHQVCTSPNVCACLEGWNGTRCETPICPSSCSSCVTPSVCATCKSGKYGVACQYSCMTNCDLCYGGDSCFRCKSEWKGETCTERSSRSVSISGSMSGTAVSSSSLSSSELFLPLAVSGGSKFAMFTTEDSKIFAYGSEIPNGTHTTTQPTPASFTPSGVSNFVGNYVSISYTNNILVGNFIHSQGINAGIYNSTYGYKEIDDFGTITWGLVEEEYSFIISNDTLYGLGLDRDGVLGLGILNTNISDYRPILSNVVTCSSGSNTAYSASSQTICIMKNNDLYGFGFIVNGYYGLRPDSLIPQLLPVKLEKGPDMHKAKLIQVVASGYFSYFLDSNGVVYMGGFFGPTGPINVGPYPVRVNSTIWDNERVVRMSYSEGAIVFTTHTGRGVALGSAVGRFSSTIISQDKREYTLAPTVMYGIERRVCSNLMDIDPMVCSGRGNCTETNKCTCEAPWVGSNCDEFSCFGISSGNASVCSRNGQCIDFDKCACREGYGGPQCDPICPTHCANCTTPYLCTKCSDGYYGVSINCVVECPLNCEKCSEGGTCEVCEEGWLGSNCDIPICFPGCESCSSPSNCSKCEGEFYGPMCDDFCPWNCEECLGPNACTQCVEGWYGATCTFPICQQNSTSNCTSCRSGWFGPQCERRCLYNCDKCTSDSYCLRCNEGWIGEYCDIKENVCGFRSPYESPEFYYISYDDDILGLVLNIPQSIYIPGVTILASSSEFNNCSTLHENNWIFETVQGTCYTFITIRRNISDIVSDKHTITSLDPNGLVWNTKFPVNIAYVLDPSLNFGVCQIVNYQLTLTVQLVFRGDSYSFVSIENSDLGIIMRQELVTTRDGRLFVRFSILLEDGMVIKDILSLPNAGNSFSISKVPSKDQEYTVEVLSNFVAQDYTDTYMFRLFVSDFGSESVTVDVPLNIRYKVPFPPGTIIEGIYTTTTFYREGKETDAIFSTKDRPNLVVSASTLNGFPLPDSLHISIDNAFLCCMNQSGAPMPVYNPSLGLLGCTKPSSSMAVWEQLVVNSTFALSNFSPLRVDLHDSMKAGLSFSASPLRVFVKPDAPLLCYVHIQSKLSHTGARRLHDISDERVFNSYNMLYFNQPNSIADSKKGGDSRLVIILSVLFGAAGLCAVFAIVTLMLVVLFFLLKKRQAKCHAEPTAVHLREFVGVLPLDKPSDHFRIIEPDQVDDTERIHVPQIRIA